MNEWLVAELASWTPRLNRFDTNSTWGGPLTSSFLRSTRTSSLISHIRFMDQRWEDENSAIHQQISQNCSQRPAKSSMSYRKRKSTFLIPLEKVHYFSAVAICGSHFEKSVQQPQNVDCFRRARIRSRTQTCECSVWRLASVSRRWSRRRRTRGSRSGLQTSRSSPEWLGAKSSSTTKPTSLVCLQFISIRLDIWRIQLNC